MREFITVTVCYDISQSVARNCSFTKPLAQHDIVFASRPSARHIFPQFEHASLRAELENTLSCLKM